MSSTNQIRRTFLDFFGKNGHEIVSSSPLVPANDPTLMFTNAGMVQFKNVFTGAENRDYSRAVTSQKCVRAGGKHNDLENVGYTARHHTFFEMLGNFSFGDYFKENAIEYAWNLVTKDLALPKEKLLVTVYSEDEDAASLWRRIAGLGDDRIIRIPTSDNFWSMGETGPCGPCSEIFFDHGDHIPGGPPGSPDEDGDRFIEIWNLVFMQFEQVAPGERVNLPRPSIDTGMGLERIAAVLQGQHSNYDIDLMRALIEASAQATNRDPDGEGSVSHRVIADHLRASAFLIADGVLPANEGRGYVLRRIMRRAMRHAHMLGAKDPVMWRLVPALVQQMGEAFPELGRAQSLVTETLKLEETRFKQTLERGLKLLEEETGRLGDGETLSGDVAFKLYDTYGFPVDLTADVLRGQGRGLDQAGFEAAMERQRAEARKNWAGSGGAAEEALWFDLRDRLGATEFLGYEREYGEAVVTALVVDGEDVATAEAGTVGTLIVNQSPFYGESGGQVGDTGLIFTANGAEFEVSDTVKRAGTLWAHQGKLRRGSLSVGDPVEMRVDGTRRTAIRCNHSATHLLHEALRRRMGDHVAQKGSLVSPDRLRFDISHPRPLTQEDIEAVEAEVNGRIRENAEVTTRLMTPDEAIEQGAMALFGEKYGEEVRVVGMGSGDTTGTWYSMELCGGTHVRRTGDIGTFKIVAEGGVAAGVRRIEALTGSVAIDHLVQQESLVTDLAETLKTTPEDLPARVQALLDDRRRLEREVQDLRRKLATGASTGPGAETVNGIAYSGQTLEDVPARELKPMAEQVLQGLGSGVVALVSVADGKGSIVVAVSKELTENLSAVDLVRLAATAMGGKGGGGRPDMAQAGGPEGARAGEALAAVRRALEGPQPVE